MGITSVKFVQTELQPVRRVIADANLDRFQHKKCLTKRNTSLNMGDFKVAQPIVGSSTLFRRPNFFCQYFFNETLWRIEFNKEKMLLDLIFCLKLSEILS